MNNQAQLRKAIVYRTDEKQSKKHRKNPEYLIIKHKYFINQSRNK